MTITLDQAAKILDVDVDIPGHELKKSWRSLARTCHPDLYPNDKEKEEQFKKYSEAYETMMAFSEIGRVGHEMQTEILDDDFRFILKLVPEEIQQMIIDQLTQLEEDQ